MEIKNLCDRLKASTFCETIHDFLRFTNENCLLNSNSACKEKFLGTLETFIMPLHIFIKCLHPKLHNQYIVNEEQWQKKLFDFLPKLGSERLVDPQILDGLGYYFDRDGDFKRFFDGSLKENGKNFWSSVKVCRKFRLLCEFALNALSVPSCTRPIDILDFKCRVNKYPQYTQHGFKALLYATWAMDRK